MGKLSSIAAGSRRMISDNVFEIKVLHEAGIVGPVRPSKMAKIGATFIRWGASPATGIATAAIHYPHEPALIDERGALTFQQVQLRTNALAHALEGMGIGPGDGV